MQPRPASTPSAAPSPQTRTAVTRAPDTGSRTAPSITRSEPAAPSAATPRAPTVSRTAPSITRSEPAAPGRTRPEISAARTPASGSSRATPPVTSREPSPRTAATERPTTARTAATRLDRDAISRLPSTAERTAATRLTRPDERSQIQAATRGTAALSHGGTSNALRPRGTADSRLAYAPASLRSDAGRLSTRDTSLSNARRSVPERVKPRIAAPRISSSRYHDGRYSVYTPPPRHVTARPAGPLRRPVYHPLPPPRTYHRHDVHRRHSSFYLNLAIGSGWYTPGWHGPAWYGPVYYPASGFSFAWSNHRYGLSIWNSTPVYVTPYYDSWVCGGWGFSSLYYGGWRSGWYGGVSYIWNPWPVYRTVYLYDPVPVVTRTETVYVTQPATQATVVYEEQPDNAPAAPPNVTPQAAPVSTTEPLLPQPVPAPATQPENTAEDAAPDVAYTDTGTDDCFCPCGCNGRRPCICDYACGAEYAVTREAFDLSLSFASYAETLDPEVIWGVYAGLDRIAASDDGTLYDNLSATAY